MIKYFDFEKPIEQLDIKIAKLIDINTNENINTCFGRLFF